MGGEVEVGYGVRVDASLFPVLCSVPRVVREAYLVGTMRPHSYRVRYKGAGVWEEQRR